MTSKFRAGDRIVLASHNPGKLREFDELLAPHGIEIVAAHVLGLPEPEETGTTFAENAALKARAAANASGLPALADDSGIEVAALGGAPGVYSADWGGPTKDFGGAMQRIHEEVQAKGLWGPDGPIANFNATLALAQPGAQPGGDVTLFEGKVFGRLIWPPRGAHGFGYDPMFQPDGETRTFGEMTSAEKHGDRHGTDGGLSHRGPRVGGW
ncbi:MAG TPA: non-canonical purine NTP pyrophosphatase [Hyphomicrobiaceae bacterium]|nr:non-canonical purine NTP pyrophosphatase [Hyphomicrobiaceae bacterium]